MVVPYKLAFLDKMFAINVISCAATVPSATDAQKRTRTLTLELSTEPRATHFGVRD